VDAAHFARFSPETIEVEIFYKFETSLSAVFMTNANVISAVMAM